MRTRGEERDVDLYMRDIGRIPRMDRETERRLVDEPLGKDDSGYEGRDMIAGANLGLVVKVANQWKGRGVELSDLIMEGNLGLLRAIDSYDASRGAGFPTYACYWIRQSIVSAVRSKWCQIRTPAASQSKARRWRARVALMAERLGRPPSEAEVASELGMSPREARRIAELADRPIAIGPLPGEDGDLDVEADQGGSPIDRIVDREDVQIVLRRLSKLTERESRIVKMRFGMAPFSEPMTLDEVGEVMGLERTTIHKIEKKALAKLTHNGD